MQLAYAQIETILERHFGVEDENRSTFRARLKQLQRHGVPLVMGASQGAKRGYSVDNLLQIIITVKLMSIGQPAMRACNIALTEWSKFQATFGIALSKSSYRQNPATFILIEASGVQTSRDIGDLSVTIHDAESAKLRIESDKTQTGQLGSPVTFLRVDELLFAIIEIVRGNQSTRILHSEFEVWQKARDSSDQTLGKEAAQ